MTLPVDPSAPTDFDFYVGSWRVRHRRLKDRLVGTTTWEEFDGRCVVTKLVGGFANVDETILEMPSGPYRALALRAFDPKTSTWSIWWLDSRDPRSLGVPVVARGAGTGLSGGAMPHAMGVTLALAKFNKIVKIDKASRTAVVQCGLRNLAISEAVAPASPPALPGDRSGSREIAAAR